MKFRLQQGPFGRGAITQTTAEDAAGRQIFVFEMTAERSAVGPTSEPVTFAEALNAWLSGVGLEGYEFLGVEDEGKRVRWSCWATTNNLWAFFRGQLQQQRPDAGGSVGLAGA